MRRLRKSPEELAQAVLNREERATARLMRLVDDAPNMARPALAKLYPHAGKAHIVGITGNPGAGKSTLVSQLITRYRQAGERVGVVAVDPSSPFSGGAILGDRVRMMEHSVDPGVFIRSVGSRGALGGISRSTEDIVTILDAYGCSVVIVETLGVGQAEVDIVQVAHTTAVVMTPGYGDDVQALKAGLLEIADLFIINKADMTGANTLARQLRLLWELTPESRRTEWRPPVLMTVARDGDGIDELIEQLDAHAEYRRTRPTGRRQERLRVRRILLRLVQEDAIREILGILEPQDWDSVLDDLVSRQRDPYTVAGELLAMCKNHQ